MSRRRNIGFLILYLMAYSVLGQLPTSTTATLPPSIHWQQINSDHFKVIYTEGNEEQAQHITNILEHVYEPASHSLGVKPRKFPIVIQNERSESNGFVTIGPYRSELFSNSPQNYLRIGNDLWLERLTVHEYRHIVQFEKALTPFNKWVYYLTGEFGAGLFAGLAVPIWFFEGDAVGVETAMGRSGRGVIPSFMMAFKANLIEKGGFNYHKQNLGSFKDFIPDHYVTGHLMTTHLKNKYGVNVWDDITNRAFKYPFLPFTFSSSIKKKTGKYLVPSYTEVVAHQEELYNEQIKKIEASPFETISISKKKTFTRYRYPQALNNGSVVALKQGFGDAPQLVQITNGKEKLLVKLGLFNDIGYLSANDQSIVWTEFEFDPRWASRNYLVIKKYDFATNKVIRLTSKSKYTSATLSSDHTMMIATHQDIHGEVQLHLLNPTTGEIIQSFDNPDKHFYSMPSFDESGENIVVLTHEGEGKSIVKKSILTGEEEKVYFSDQENIGAPRQSGDHIYYNTNRNGVDNIFRVNWKTKEVHQVTASIYGAFNPSFDSNGKTIYYQDYTVEGENIVRIDLDQLKMTPIDKVQNLETGFVNEMIEEEDIKGLLYNAPSVTYETKKYSEFLNSIRPVSWGITTESESNGYTLSATSRDILATSIVKGGARYNYSEKVWRGFASYSYQSLYPIIDLDANWGKRSFDSDSIGRVEWEQRGVRLAMRVPLNLTQSRMISNARIRIASSVNQISGLPSALFDNFPRRQNGYLNTLSGSFSYSRTLRRSRLDIGSRWGYSIRLNALLTPYGGDYKSNLGSIQGNLFLPGFFKHHSVRLRGAYQSEQRENYFFSSPISFTRGYSYHVFDHYNNYQINYALPLVYPDFHLGPIINFQRIYTNVFFDYGIGDRSNLDIQHFRSLGSELFFNFNLFRYRLLFNAGVRYTYLLENGNRRIDLIIGGISF